MLCIYTLVLLFIVTSPALAAGNSILQPDYAVGWLSLSLIIAGLAKAYNRYGLGWWILGLLLGPLALLILVLLGKARSQAFGMRRDTLIG